MILGIPLSLTAMAAKPATSPIIYLVSLGNEVDNINSGWPIAVMQVFQVVIWALAAGWYMHLRRTRKLAGESENDSVVNRR